jgi:cytochrome oxidase Cu insertion factor (SCO1/SenC/PrrC family)
MNVQPEHWRPSATTNEGTLVAPPRAVLTAGLTHLDGSGYDAGLFGGVWTLVSVDSTACRDRACEAQLIKMRQARLALGKDMGRVQRLYAALEMPQSARLSELQRAHPGLHIAQVNQQWLTPFKLDSAGTEEASGVYLVDPEGRLMMHYSQDAQAEGILKDLQRLLKISKIG